MRTAAAARCTKKPEPDRGWRLSGDGSVSRPASASSGAGAGGFGAWKKSRTDVKNDSE
jgi:hypothetical protein